MGTAKLSAAAAQTAAIPRSGLSAARCRIAAMSATSSPAAMVTASAKLVTSDSRAAATRGTVGWAITMATGTSRRSGTRRA